MNEKQTEYVGVTLPKSLTDDIDYVIQGKKGGYRSRAEFLKDAARQLLYKINSNGNTNNYQPKQKGKMEKSSW